MATWNPPADVVLGAGKPGKPSHARAIRDLPTALAERAAGAPWINRVGRTEILQARDLILTTPAAYAGEYDLVGAWVVPLDVYRIDVTLVGGGGSGGTGVSSSGTFNKKTGGGGGGAGAVRRVVIDVIPEESYQFKIGAGGRLEAAVGVPHPSVDIALDGFELGDGARTTFGAFVAAGGKAGERGSLGGAGGAGGGQTDVGFPNFYGADGGPWLDTDNYDLYQIRSGRGGVSVYGGGAPGRSDVGVGYSSFGVTLSIPGAGGGGGHPNSGVDTKDGGRGANGAIILRY